MSRLLLIDDDPAARSLACAVLAARLPSAAPEEISDAMAFAEALLAGDFDAVVMASPLSWTDALAVLQTVRRAQPHCAVVLLGGPGCEDVAAAALRAGADAYVPKTTAGWVDLPGTLGQALEARSHGAPPAAQGNGGPGEGPPADHASAPPPPPHRSADDETTFLVHDLKAPLRTITRYCQVLDSHTPDTPEAQEALGLIRRAAERMRDQIGALLEGGPAHEVQATSHLGLVLDQTLDALAGPVRETSATVRRGTLPTLAVPPASLGQVLQNLVDNAIKYRGERPPRIRVAADRSGGEWTVRVADQGPGVPEGEAERIFGMFQRGTAGDGVPGTGVGLANCRRIVESWGGRIWVEPGADRGATFCFTAPDAGAADGSGSVIALKSKAIL